MKKLLGALLVGVPLTALSQELEFTIEHEGNGVFVIDWKSAQANPGEGTVFTYAYQLQGSLDLENWVEVGDPIPTRIDGEGRPESITLTDPVHTYFRLAYQVDLSGQSFSGADLSNITLTGANLENVDFSGADLSEAILFDAKLEGAVLNGANLDGTKFDSWTSGLYQLTEFTGPFNAPLSTLPELPTYGAEGDFVTDIVGYETISTSRRTLVIQLAPGTTIGALNALIAEFDGQVAGTLGSSVGMSEPLVALRFDATSEEICTLKADLLAEPTTVRVLHDIGLAERVQPSYEGRDILGDGRWRWNNPGEDDWNWGLKYARVPAMWNFNDAIEKLRHERGTTPEMISTTVVLDAGFNTRHPALATATAITNFYPTSHGTHVAGTVGAEFTNHRDRRGHGEIEGVDPFCNLHLMQYAFNFSYMSQLKDILWLKTNHDARVINCSFGHSWSTTLADGSVVVTPPASRPDLQMEMTSWAAYTGLVLNALESSTQVPFLVIAAGNDGVDTQWAGGLERYARTIGSDHILTVGNQDLLSDDFAANSNTNVDVMAPGTEIGSAIIRKRYARYSGTSFAAPHVAGLASFLLHLNPQLTNLQLKSLITRNNIIPPAPGGNPTRINAFESVLLLDTVAPVPERSAKLMLLDVDDGTPDGNLRMRYDPPESLFPEDPPCTTLYTKEWTNDPGDPGGLLNPDSVDLFLPGDGVLDMSDFRKWRDYWQYSFKGGTPELKLDGGANHPKLDGNHNGKVDPPLEEQYWARTDFNGDGVLTGFVVDPATGKSDLDILAESGEWSDPYVPVGDLTSLVDSGDLRIVATDAVLEFLPNFDRVVIEISGGGWERTREVLIPIWDIEFFWNYHVQDFLVTVPVGSHDVTVTFERNGGARSATFQRNVTVGLCEDVFFAVDFGDMNL